MHHLPPARFAPDYVGGAEVLVCRRAAERGPFRTFDGHARIPARGAAWRAILHGVLLPAVALAGLLLAASEAHANPPVAKYIFPAGGQRGTTVAAKVGGCFFHGEAGFEMLGPGVRAPSSVREVPTTWFEGPLIPQPASQQPEDYPRDHACPVTIAPDAPLGARSWRAWTSQGATPALRFVVGDLPEVVEQEVEGAPGAVRVELPVTINGRIFPRENVDAWAFTANAGQQITCDVQAKRLGSPLEAELRVTDPAGRAVATRLVRVAGGDPRIHFTAPTAGLYQVRINDVALGGLQHYVYRLTITAGPIVDSIYPLGGRRGSKVRFELGGHALAGITAEVELPAEGSDEWTTQFEQGGRKTNPVMIDMGDLPEALEAEPNDRPADVRPIAVPAMLNGRIEHPGDVDYWAIDAKRDQAFELELSAARLGSPLDSVVIVEDAQGKLLVRNDDAAAGQPDSQLTFKAPADGTYYVRVQDRFASRGGSAFAYRLRVAPARPDFRLTVSADALTLPRLDEGLMGPPERKAPPPPSALLKVDVQRLGGFDGPIKLAFDGLPAGVVVEGAVIAAKQLTAQLKLTALPATKIATAHLRLRGTADVAGESVVRQAAIVPATAAPASPTGTPTPTAAGAPDDLLLAVAMPTPFKSIGAFETPFVPCGSVFRRTYRLDRGGFDGPLTVRLADRQIRHLQGVTGPTITVPAGHDTFEYAVALAPEMELGRTSRSVIQVSGVVRDRDGSAHVVSYSSGEQNDQFCAVATASLLTVRLERSSLLARPGTEESLEVVVQRAESIAGQPVRVELIPPGAARDVAADALTIPADQDRGVLRLRFGASPGPFARAAVVRATVPGPGDPSVAEAQVDLVPPSSIPGGR